ncbi:unnamed protein product [Rotaria sp. Silwood1]|nr:unnamed protein product [Rotaria sp. Silwood1]
MWKNLNEETNENLTTTLNESSTDNEISIFHKRTHVPTAFITFLRIFAQAFLIFGGVIPYIPQYLVIKRTRNAEGFSNYVCLTLLIANIIRIEFWFGKRFETPLLLQSIVMIICMLIMLELWTRIHTQTIRRSSIVDASSSISNSREQLTDEITDKKFTDFDVDFFWRWTTFSSYLQFLFLFTLALSIITWILHKNLVYIETIGLLAVFCEALLGVPQFIRNLRFKSTEGMSVKMVIFWAAGDIFKTVYFIVRNAPKQFWICGILQISIDFAILIQVMVYSNLVLFRSARLFTSSTKKKSSTNDDDLCISHLSNRLCPICRCPYDNQKHKRLIDTTCHHEKCYTCMFKYEQCSICLSHLVKNRCIQDNNTYTMRSTSPSNIPTSNSQTFATSTIIANNLLVQASPPMSRSTIERPPPTPIKPVSHFQKLLHHFNGNKSINNSFTRGTPLTTSQQRSAIKTNGSMTTIIKNTNNNNNKCPEQLSPKQQSDEPLPPPPPPEMAHEQLLDILFQGNRTRISSISPSLSTSSATTHTSIQRLMMNKKKQQQQQQVQINPASISPSMSNSDLSFSPSGINVLSPSIETFSGYEIGPMSKTIPNTMVESQTWSSPRYITTPSSSSPSTHTCHCNSNLNNELNSIHDDEKFFIQRDWIYDEIFKLLKGTTKPGLVLLSHTPGMGKTWLMKNLLRTTNITSQKPTSVITRNERSSIIRVNSARKTSYEWLKSHILSSHFCDCSQTDTCSLPDIIHSIIYRALEHPLLHAYRDVILREQHTRKAITLNACIQNVEHAFFTAFLDQLNQLKLLGHLQELFSITNHIYLIIDGINNELCDTEGQTITEFLFANLHRIPSWLKLIITMNRLDDNQHQIEQNTFLQNFAVLDIEDESRFSNFLHNDIRKYLSKRLENDCSNELYDLSSSMSNIDQLCTLSHGNIFFIQQICDVFEQREFPSNIDLPRTLNEIFYYRFLNNKIQEHIEVCRAILEICLASRRSINLNVLYNCLNIDEELHIEWSIFLQCISHLSVFVTQYSNSTYAIVHGSIRHWLITYSNQHFACNIKKGHSRLALYLSRSLTTPLHGPEAIECIRHLSLSDLFSNNIIQLCHIIKHLINDSSRLLASLRNTFYPELNISELLLMTSADPDSIVNSIHMPLLCIASRNGYTSFVELLLKYHANVNLTTKDNENKTALMLAAEYGHEQVVKLLMNYNADVSPSTWALAAGKNDMMTILISKLIDDGISLYKKNQYKDAAYRFAYALKKLPIDNDQQTTDQFTTNFLFMKYNCLINLAKCKRKLNSYEGAIDYCTQALYIHNTSDGLLLRSRIKRDQKLYDDALTDLLAAKSLDPTNNDLDRYINRLNADLQHCHETLL